jgi:hypothetical protein
MGSTIPPIAIVGAILAIMEDDDEDDAKENLKRKEESALIAFQAKRAIDQKVHQEGRKKDVIYYDWDRAKKAVEHDYFWSLSHF